VKQDQAMTVLEVRLRATKNTYFREPSVQIFENTVRKIIGLKSLDEVDEVVCTVHLDDQQIATRRPVFRRKVNKIDFGETDFRTVNIIAIDICPQISDIRYQIFSTNRLMTVNFLI
jgi:hypothetical protein